MAWKRQFVDDDGLQRLTGHVKTFPETGRCHQDPARLSRVIVFLPSWQDLLPDGTCFEGKGIEPDISVKAEPAEFLKADPVLEAALRYLRAK